jgi:molybdate transport system ATP-binding protein
MVTFNFNVRTRLGAFQLDAQFEAGNHITVLLGPSGAGKTTVFRHIAGFIKPDEGSIQLHGQMLADTTRHIHLSAQERNLGYVFQHHALFPHLTVLQNVVYGHPHSQGAAAETEARGWIERLGLTGLEQNYPASLSGGERQRVALARALISRPQMLLLDEPLSAVDYTLRQAIRGDLIALQRQLAIPMLIITHDLSEALVMADQLVMMEQGRVTGSGTVQEMMARPQNQQWVQGLSASLAQQRVE